MRFLRRIGVFVAVLGITLVGLVSPAHASDPTSRNCSINGAYFFLPNSCSTGYLQANSDYHAVWFEVSPYSGCSLDYRVVDIVNGVTVASGRAYSGNGIPFSVSGLYSYYYLYISNTDGPLGHCGGWAFLRNYY